MKLLQSLCRDFQTLKPNFSFFSMSLSPLLVSFQTVFQTGNPRGCYCLSLNWWSSCSLTVRSVFRPPTSIEVYCNLNLGCAIGLLIFNLSRDTTLQWIFMVRGNLQVRGFLRSVATSRVVAEDSFPYYLLCNLLTLRLGDYLAFSCWWSETQRRWTSFLCFPILSGFL